MRFHALPVSFSFATTSALTLTLFLAGCGASGGTTGGQDTADTKGETLHRASALATDLNEAELPAAAAYTVVPADGNCPAADASADADVGNVPCAGFWLRRVNDSQARWSYVNGMEIRGLFTASAEVDTFVSSAYQGRAIVIGSIVIGSRLGIVIGSRTAIVIGSRNGIVIGSRSGIVIGSRDTVLLPAHAYVSSYNGSVDATFVRARDLGCSSPTPCGRYELLPLNAPTDSRATIVTSVTSQSSDVAASVTDGFTHGEIVVSGSPMGATFNVTQFFRAVGTATPIDPSSEPPSQQAPSQQAPAQQAPAQQ